MKYTRYGASLLILTQVTSHGALIWHSAMDGNANAIVGPDGVVRNGSPTATADRFGNPDSAVVFDGDDNYTLGTTPISTTLSAGTMAFWARTDSAANNTGPVAMGISGNSTAEYFAIGNRDDGSWRADVDNGVSRLDAFDNDPAIALGIWHHVAATFAADGDLTIYINGVAQSDVQALTADHDLANLDIWTLGSERLNNRFYNGALDDVRLYDNALTAAEIGILAGIPEPSITALFSLASLALFRRRRA